MYAAHQSHAQRCINPPTPIHDGSLVNILDNGKSFDNATMALAQGLLEGGASYCINYPGFKSHEIVEAVKFLANTFKLSTAADATAVAEPFVNDGMALNEKVAYEMCFGASLAGRRSLVTMKNFGMSVAADPFLNSLLTGVNAGIVLCVTDDMEVCGSQGQFDSRTFREFYGGLWLEPATLHDAYTFARMAFGLSEKLDVPVVIRLTNNFFKCEGPFSRIEEEVSGFSPTIKQKEYLNKFVVHPSTWENQAKNLEKKKLLIQEWVNGFHTGDLSSNDCVVFTCGACLIADIQKVYAICEGGSTAKVLSIVTYPLPSQYIDLIKDHSIYIVDYTDYTRNLLLQQMHTSSLIMTCRPV